MRISSAPAPRIGGVADDWAVQKGSYRRERVFREAHSAGIDRSLRHLDSAGARRLDPAAGGANGRHAGVSRRLCSRIGGAQAIHRALRFAEVTQALATALGRQTLRADALAFRLDGTVEHLLLDEFQARHHAQWHVLRPMAGITTTNATPPRSFFCVGDVKQAIYGWRRRLGGDFRYP